MCLTFLCKPAENDAVYDDHVYDPVPVWMDDFFLKPDWSFSPTTLKVSCFSPERVKLPPVHAVGALGPCVQVFAEWVWGLSACVKQSRLFVLNDVSGAGKCVLVFCRGLCAVFCKYSLFFPSASVKRAYWVKRQKSYSHGKHYRKKDYCSDPEKGLGTNQGERNWIKMLKKKWNLSSPHGSKHISSNSFRGWLTELWNHGKHSWMTTFPPQWWVFGNFSWEIESSDSTVSKWKIHFCCFWILRHWENYRMFDVCGVCSQCENQSWRPFLFTAWTEKEPVVITRKPPQHQEVSEE